MSKNEKMVVKKLNKTIFKYVIVYYYLVYCSLSNLCIECEILNLKLMGVCMGGGLRRRPTQNRDREYLRNEQPPLSVFSSPTFCCFLSRGIYVYSNRSLSL